MPKYFQSSDVKHPKNHILVLRHAKHHIHIFSYDKGCLLGPSNFEERNKSFFSFVEYILFASVFDSR